MEPGIKEFFKRLVSSISLLVLWMMINMVLGIKYNFGFFEEHVQWYNIVFYLWLVASIVALIWIFKKIWEKPIDDLNDQNNS